MTIFDVRGKSAEEFGAARISGFPVWAIHGYNEPEKPVEDAYGNFERMLGRPLSLFMWPGGDFALDYVEAVKRARQAGGLFNGASFGTLRVPVVTHSLGARVLYESYMKCPLSILMAPAIPEDMFAAAPIEGETHVLFSRNDEVLKRAFPVGDGIADGIFLPRALGYAGLSKSIPGVTCHDCTEFVHDHGDYLWKPEAIALVKQILDDWEANPGQ